MKYTPPTFTVNELLFDELHQLGIKPNDFRREAMVDYKSWKRVKEWEAVKTITCIRILSCINRNWSKLKWEDLFKHYA